MFHLLPFSMRDDKSNLQLQLVNFKRKDLENYETEFLLRFNGDYDEYS